MKPIGIKAWKSIVPQFLSWEKIRAGKSSLAFNTNLGVASGKIPLSNQELVSQLSNQHKNYKQLDRSVLLALSVADSFQNLPLEMGVNFGSSRGATEKTEKSIQTFIENKPLSPSTSPHTTLGNISTWVGHHLGNKGVNLSHSVTCSTGLHALLNGVAWVNSDMAKHMLCGASEAPLTPYTIAQMSALKIYSNLQEGYVCRSMDWHKTENTMVLGESASAILVGKLEKSDAFQISGIGWGSEHITHPADISEHAECLQLSMRKALASANLQTVDALVMHAPGTVKGDIAEKSAITTVFGENTPALTSNKWAFGHTFSTSGLLNVDMALEMLKHQSWIPNPIQPYEAPTSLQHIMVNAIGFGGNAVSIIISKTVL
jgi:3-oxoacyl-[acyl-carrier-protein] synthase II